MTQRSRTRSNFVALETFQTSESSDIVNQSCSDDQLPRPRDHDQRVDVLALVLNQVQDAKTVSKLSPDKTLSRERNNISGCKHGLSV